MGVPVPTLCPECRFKRRALFRNEMTLYNRKCDLCKKAIISMYNPKSPYTVYCHACYASEQWDPSSYGMDYDSSKPFFEQLGELLRRVPKNTTYTSAAVGPNINSEYTNVAGGNKNCYLVFNSASSEDTRYARGILNCKDSADLYFSIYLERCYEVVNVHRSHGVCWSQNASACVDSAFLYNCSGCTSCFGCVNLRNKSNYFFNEPLAKDEYKKRVSEVMGSYARIEEIKRQFDRFRLKFPHREHNNMKTVNSVGDYLFESKNLFHCFESIGSEDCKYTFSNKMTRDSYDITGYGYKAELLLECVAVGHTSRAIGCYGVVNSRNSAYCFSGENLEDCIGCDSIKHAKFCLLNRRYEEREYKEIRERIIKELRDKNLYGLSMPPEIAPFAYNETVAQDNLPLTKNEVLAQGFRWEDDIQMTKGKETFKPERIPDHIRDVPDTIVNEILACISCDRNYHIIEPELAFYKSMTLPIPRQCFFCRHRDRIRRRGPFKIFDRACARCNKAIKTTFAPERPETVYCERCYNAEVA